MNEVNWLMFKRISLLLALGIVVLSGVSLLYAADIGNMVLVPNGIFTMGSSDPTDRDCTLLQQCQHKVFLDDYYIDKNEVTMGEYAKCVKAGYCSANDIDIPKVIGNKCNWEKGRDSHPVNCVDWYQAKNYCEWVGKRLPTEAEWEKAARGSADVRKYPWGDNEFGSTEKYGNVADKTFATQEDPYITALKATHMVYGSTKSELRIDQIMKAVNDYDDGWWATAPVGSFPAGASPYGALDMAGNVSEWTADYYQFEYYKNSPRNNPKGPASGRERVFRGCTWYEGNNRKCKVSVRGYADPWLRRDSVGFRCAWDKTVKEQNTAQREDIWHDPQYNLTWQVALPKQQMNRATAQAYCANLTLGGYTDWRLPSIYELRTLIRGCPLTEAGGDCYINSSCDSSSGWCRKCEGCSAIRGPGAQGFYLPPELPDANKASFISSSTYSEKSNDKNPKFSWNVNYVYGSVLTDHEPSNVRCVR